MEEMIKRAHKIEDLMTTNHSLFLNVRLPSKFKMPILDKFDETGCPKSHLKMWFLNQDDARARSWEDICCKFHNQYKYNIEVDITRRDLETMKQEPKEAFSTFITKQRSKATQMMNKPYEEEQREFHELYMLVSQVFEKLKAKGLLKPLDPRPIPNPLPARFDVTCKRIPMVLIDDGSALYVCPLKTASYLGLSVEDFVPIDQHMKAYDNSRREVLGTVTVELTIGPMIKKVEF
ncbi:hypothetical protein SO802_015168 [Lithocarpus litseifolius]|uniref:Retrotransposon gag domain-containing protein n=1 Tax=Lithocarpus litseifolius TaxID=425828 RepID=A0AAW2CSX6_9ROSI